MVNWTSYLKSMLAPESEGLSENEAFQLMAAALDGGMPELELGMMLATVHLRGPRAAELMGFLHAVQARVNQVALPPGTLRPVVLPAYGGGRELPNLTPLLALLLARFGVPVLIHGTLEGVNRIATAYVLRELGILPSTTPQAASVQLDQSHIAFLPIAALAPGLGTLHGLKNRLGLSGLTFLLAQLIEPFDGRGLRVVAVDRERDWPLVDRALVETPGDALALDATEGEPFANLLRRPRIVRYTDAIPHIVFERERESLQALTNMPPHHDAVVTAHWIQQALDHEVPIPLPIVNQLACCLYAAGYTQDLNQAKAIVAVETGSLAAA